jgi:hypothetical protein
MKDYIEANWRQRFEPVSEADLLKVRHAMAARGRRSRLRCRGRIMIAVHRRLDSVARR